MKNDRTLQAIGRQLKAMGCERFDIGVRDATTGQMMNREWSAAEVLQNTPWLKRMNAQGNDVYIRPAEQERHGLVLVDDLSEFDLDDMKAEGREPALVVETSPKNYQAWVKVADAAGGELRGQIARTLASEYDADPASADSRHYGRLAGFTNRKDKHTTRTGYQPWVLLRESKGKTATAGPELMQQAGQV
ncbi:DNA-primase RepB domain-containing protein, partial [Vibrio sp. Y184]|uniref:DNA-primase RepB domain-containing protein n=1 Tax=Vibrio sp. Y184 TaxID=3074705 RepID=UPI0029673C3E